MSNKTELSLEPVEGELLPTGKIPTVTPEQVNVLAVIQSVSKVEVLANAEETAAGIERMKVSYLPIIKKAKAEISSVKTKADFERSKKHRFAIRDERQGFVDTIDNELAARKLVVTNATEGKKLVEAAFKLLESELDAVEKPVDERLKAAAAAKKALADAIAKLKNHAINPLLSAVGIETAIDDFSIAFGDFDYQESQEAAEKIFEAKMNEFKIAFQAAVVREENERKVKKQEEEARQRKNIASKFDIAAISAMGSLSSEFIDEKIVAMKCVDMSAFELVAGEAETAKQACLGMLNAFLTMAVSREAKEAADKAEAERVKAAKLAVEQIADIPNACIGKKSGIILEVLNGMTNDGIGPVWHNNYPDFKNEAELALKDAIARLTVILDGTLKKEYQDDWDSAIAENNAIDLVRALISKKQAEIDAESILEPENKSSIESAVIAIINDDAGVAEDVAKIIGEPSQNDCEPQDLEVIEVVSGVADDCVLIPVKHLQTLIYAAKQAAKHCDLDDDDTIAAIEFAESLI